MSVRFHFQGDLVRKLRELEKKVKAKTLRKIGNEVGKLVKPVMQAETPDKSGRLDKSYAVKVKVYRGQSIIAVIVGPRSKLVYAIRNGKAKKVAAKDFSRNQKNRQWQFKREGGVKYDRPSKRAHLAGPRRKSKVVKRTLARVKPRVMSIVRRVFREMHHA